MNEYAKGIVHVCRMAYDGMNINDSDETSPLPDESEKAKSSMLWTFVVRHTLPRFWSPVSRDIKKNS